VVCDGALGNILLKFGEGIAKFTFNALKDSISQSILAKIGARLMKKSLVGLRKRLDYSEYGGAPLLGVNGVCIICHGGSQAKAIKNAVKVAQEFVNHKVNDRIVEAIAAHNEKYGKINGK
jgi:phosphate acyltransferase